MKAYVKKIGLRTFSAKEIFELVEQRGVGIGDDGIEVVNMSKPEDVEQYYRVKCRNQHYTFDVGREVVPTNNQFHNGDWIYAEGISYIYHSNDNAVHVSMNKAWEILSGLIPDPREEFKEWVGRKVHKTSKDGNEPKPFKSGRKINTVKEIIEHPILHVPAFTFEEDESFVECRRCLLAAL